MKKCNNSEKKHTKKPHKHKIKKPKITTLRTVYHNFKAVVVMITLEDNLTDKKA